MRERLGVGIVGLGWVASQYIKSFLRNEQCEIRGACVRDRERGRATLNQYGLNKCTIYTHLDSMLEDKGIDVVCILTPNNLHLQQAVRCAEAGKHLIIEKPAALNWEEAKILQSKLNSCKVKNIVGFVLRWNSLFKTIRDLLRRGVIGRTFHIEIDYMFHLDGRFKCFDWCSKKVTGGSVLIQSGCHAVDGLCYFAGKMVRKVIALSSQNRNDLDHPGTYTILLQFEGGETGKILCSYDTAHPYIYDIKIYGERGSIRRNSLYAKDYFPGQIDWATIPSVMPDTENVENHPFPELVNYFVDCIRSDTMPVPSVNDGMHVFEIIEAAERSAKRGGEPITIPFI